MRRAAKIAGLILLALGLPAFAHAQIIEQQSCPSSTTPITAPGTTTINNVNGQILRQWCVDNNGNMYSTGHYHNGTETFTGRIVDAGHLIMNPSASDWCAELTAAVALLPSAGGKIESVAQGTQTCAAGVSISKPAVQIIIAPGMTIPLGTNQFSLTSAALRFSMNCSGATALGTGNANAPACKFTYTGTGDAFKLGDTSARLYGIDIEGISADISGAGSAAVGMHGYQLFNSRLAQNEVTCSGSASTQDGFTIDGTTGLPGFSDLNVLTNNRATSCGGSQLHVIDGTSGVNGLSIYGGEYNCGSVAGAKGIYLSGGTGGTTSAFGPDVEGCAIGMEVANNNNRNLFIRTESNTLDVQFDFGAQYNAVYTSNAGATITDNSGNQLNSFNALPGIQLSGNGSNTAVPSNLKAGQFGTFGSVRMSTAAANSGIYGSVGAVRSESEAASSFSAGSYGGYDFSITDKGAGGLFESSGTIAAAFGALSGQPGTHIKQQMMTNGAFQLAGTIQTVGGGSTMGMAIKKGSGVGNYTNATTSYTVADATNLCYTVTIPTGWKLGISVSGALSTATAAVPAQAALTDNAACSTANAGILVETAPIQGAGINVADGFALNWVITGDGASHNIALQFKTSNAADTASLINSSATVTPTIKFELMPSN